MNASKTISTTENRQPDSLEGGIKMINAPWILSYRIFTKNISRIRTEKTTKKSLAKDWPKTRFKLYTFRFYQKNL